ncbi:187-kDa microtubule-associated protein AIR9 [Diplonema papillatum]|nr:187-kDa microtubule-associated protein AIR9 [Diplonema papillatum]
MASGQARMRRGRSPVGGTPRFVRDQRSDTPEDQRITPYRQATPQMMTPTPTRRTGQSPGTVSRRSGSAGWRNASPLRSATPRSPSPTLKTFTSPRGRVETLGVGSSPVISRNKTDMSTVRQLAHANPKVEYLYLRENDFSDFDPWQPLEHLKVLDLSLNGITSSDFLWDFGRDETVLRFTKIRHLYLTGNAVSSLQGFCSMPLLETLTLSSNAISSFDGLFDLPNLRVLSLHHNDIDSMRDFPHLPKLMSINLMGNPVQRSPVYRPLVVCACLKPDGEHELDGLGGALKIDNRPATRDEVRYAMAWDGKVRFAVLQGFVPGDGKGAAAEGRSEKREGRGARASSAGALPPRPTVSRRLVDELEVEDDGEWMKKGPAALCGSGGEDAVTLQAGAFLFKQQNDGRRREQSNLDLLAINADATGTHCEQGKPLQLSACLRDVRSSDESHTKVYRSKHLVPMSFRVRGQANSVQLVTSLNQFKPIPMVRDADGLHFSATLYTTPGACWYKYVVDGVDIIDDPAVDINERSPGKPARRFTLLTVPDAAQSIPEDEDPDPRDCLMHVRWLRSGGADDAFTLVCDSDSIVYVPTAADVGRCLRAEVLTYYSGTFQDLVFDVTPPIAPCDPSIVHAELLGQPMEGNALVLKVQYEGGVEEGSQLVWFRENPRTNARIAATHPVYITQRDRRRRHDSIVSASPSSVASSFAEGNYHADSAIESVPDGRSEHRYTCQEQDIGHYIVAVYRPCRIDGTVGVPIEVRSEAAVRGGVPVAMDPCVVSRAVEGKPLVVDFTYGAGAQGEHLYEWRKWDSVSKGFRAPGEKSTSRSYVPTGDDINNPMQVVITPVSASGLQGEPVTLVTPAIAPCPPHIVGLRFSIAPPYREGNILKPVVEYRGGTPGTHDIHFEGPSAGRQEVHGEYLCTKADVGSVVTVRVKPVRSDGVTGPVESFSTTAVEESLPVVKSLAIAGAPFVGAELRCRAEYSGGKEGRSVIEWGILSDEDRGIYDWSAGGGTDTVLLDERDVGVIVACRYTPVRSDGTVGIPVIAVTKRVNDSPKDVVIVEEVAAEGKPQVGNMLVGCYKVRKTADAPKSDTPLDFRWSYAGEEPGSSLSREKTYDLTKADVGRALVFQTRVAGCDWCTSPPTEKIRDEPLAVHLPEVVVEGDLVSAARCMNRRVSNATYKWKIKAEGARDYTVLGDSDEYTPNRKDAGKLLTLTVVAPPSDFDSEPATAQDTRQVARCVEQIGVLVHDDAEGDVIWLPTNNEESDEPDPPASRELTAGTKLEGKYDVVAEDISVALHWEKRPLGDTKWTTVAKADMYAPTYYDVNATLRLLAVPTIRHEDRPSMRGTRVVAEVGVVRKPMSRLGSTMRRRDSVSETFNTSTKWLGTSLVDRSRSPNRSPASKPQRKDDSMDVSCDSDGFARGLAKRRSSLGSTLGASQKWQGGGMRDRTSADLSVDSEKGPAKRKESGPSALGASGRWLGSGMRDRSRSPNRAPSMDVSFESDGFGRSAVSIGGETPDKPGLSPGVQPLSLSVNAGAAAGGSRLGGRRRSQLSDRDDGVPPAPRRRSIREQMGRDPPKPEGPGGNDAGKEDSTAEAPPPAPAPLVVVVDSEEDRDRSPAKTQLTPTAGEEHTPVVESPTLQLTVSEAGGSAKTSPLDLTGTWGRSLSFAKKLSERSKESNPPPPLELAASPVETSTPGGADVSPQTTTLAPQSALRSPARDLAATVEKKRVRLVLTDADITAGELLDVTRQPSTPIDDASPYQRSVSSGTLAKGDPPYFAAVEFPSGKKGFVGVPYVAAPQYLPSGNGAPEGNSRIRWEKRFDGGAWDAYPRAESVAITATADDLDADFRVAATPVNTRGATGKTVVSRAVRVTWGAELAEKVMAALGEGAARFEAQDTSAGAPCTVVLSQGRVSINAGQDSILEAELTGSDSVAVSNLGPETAAPGELHTCSVSAGGAACTVGFEGQAERDAAVVIIRLWTAMHDTSLCETVLSRTVARQWKDGMPGQVSMTDRLNLLQPAFEEPYPSPPTLAEPATLPAANIRTLVSFRRYMANHGLASST